MKNVYKRLGSLLLCLAMVLSLVPPVSVTAADMVYLIESEEDFYAIMEDPYASYRLETDLDLGVLDKPLGTNPYTTFYGSLDGNGHSIRYSQQNIEGCYYYGLFYSLCYAEITNLNLYADIRLEVSGEELGSFEVAPLCASGYDTTVTNVTVEGSITVTGDSKNKLLRLWSLAASCTAAHCRADVDIDVRVPRDTQVQYQGLNAAPAYFCELYGDVYLEGGPNVRQLYQAQDCIASQNLQLVPFYLSGILDVEGSFNYLENTLTIQPYPGESEVSASMTLLHNSVGSCYVGDVEILDCAPSFTGAYGCQGVEIRSNISANNPEINSYKMYGLRNTTDSVYRGDVQILGGNGSFTGLTSCQRCLFEGSVTQNTLRCDGITGANLSSDCVVEGDIYIHTTEASGYIRATGLSNCQRSTYTGDIHTISDHHNAEAKGADEYSTGCIVMGDLTADSPISSDVTLAGDDCYYEGTVRARNVSGIGSNSSAKANIYTTTKDGAYVTLIRGDNSYFSGNVTMNAKYCDFFAFEGSNSVANVDVSIKSTEKWGYTNGLWDSWLNHSAVFSTIPREGGNNSFSGNVTIRANGSVGINSAVPVTIHHSKVGTRNSQNIHGSLWRHRDGGCDCGQAYILNRPSLSDRIPSYPGDYPCYAYDCIIEVYSGVPNVSAGDASAGWDGSIDIEGRYEPEREPASYGIQLTDMLDQPIPDAKLILGGASYITDEGGCVYLENGPGVISPLKVQMKNADGKYETVLTRKSCYPIPNRTNVIRLAPVVDLDVTFLASENAVEDGGIAKGGQLDIGGHTVPLLEFPLNVDIEASLGESLSFETEYDYHANKLYVAIGSGYGDTAHSQFDKEAYKALVEALKGTGDSWKRANQMLQNAESVPNGMGFGSWETKFMGYVEMQFGDDWHITDSGFLVGAEGELRAVYPFSIPGIYGTLGLEGEAETKGRLTPRDTDRFSDVTYGTSADIDVEARIEAAIGAGIRSARLYAEIGVGGELNAQLRLPWESAEKSLEINSLIDAFGEVSCLMYSYDITLMQKSIPVWPQRAAANVLSRAISQGGNFTISPRNYAQGAVMQTMSADTRAVSYLGLNEHNSYPYAEVRLLKLNNGNYLLVYTDDDLSRGSADRSALRACIGTVQEDGNLLWGEAVTIENDGTGDYGFAVTTDGYNVAILWQDSNTTFGDGNGVTPEDMAKSITLSQTWLDCNGAIPVPGYIATLAEAGSMPYHPVIFFDNEGLSAAWVTSSNPDPSVYLDDETETLWLSTGGAPGQIAVEGQKNISGLALLGSDLFWTGGTQENVTLYHRTADGAVTESDSGNIRSLQSSGQNLCYVKDTDLYWATSTNPTPRQQDTGDGYDNILRLSADGKVYAAQPGTESSRILEIVESKTLPIGEYEGYLSSWDVCDGHIVTVVRSGFTENDTAGFTSEPARQIEDTEVRDLTWDNPEAAPGSYVTFTADISNDGYNEITTLPVVITAADGRVLLEQELTCDIQPGETGEIEFAFPVPEGFSPQDVTVNLGDRTQTATLGGSNLKVDAKWSKARPDGLSVAVSNTGIGAASGTVTVSDGSKTLYSGEVTAAEGEIEDIWIPFENGYSQITDLTVTLTEASGAVHSYDNDATVTVIPQKLQALLCQDLELAPGESAELTVNPRPVNATLPHLRYRSEDTGIATVDEQGCVTAIAPGETHIIVSTAEGIDTWVRVTVPGEPTPEETTPQETEPAETEPSEPQPTQPEVTEPSVPEDTRPTKPSEPEDTKPTEPEDPDPTEPKYDNPFEDVFEADYYYDPVLWAVNEGITNGMDATHFAPAGTCTRAQIVTFLWRANGSPEAGGNNPFTDVPADAWYTNAVLWAVENGITTGTSATTFSPDAGCTRGQVATFLWRSQGQPSVNGENIFTDIAPGAYYYDAVLWAVANGITNGMGEGLFAPDATCTRGQIVTFLYRAMNG